ncbi:hypothetical protein LMG33818_000015 [Halomonadaceae bacterium LMG 33818]|uniref:hypothetical protein n=1 Tax=Cernens ardua TaxID=3402176 RepID=UPI003EDC846A
MTSLANDDSYNLSKEILFALVSSPYCENVIEDTDANIEDIVRNLLITREQIEDAVKKFKTDTRSPMKINPELVKKAISRSKRTR